MKALDFTLLTAGYSLNISEKEIKKELSNSDSALSKTLKRLTISLNSFSSKDLQSAYNSEKKLVSLFIIAYNIKHESESKLVIPSGIYASFVINHNPDFLQEIHNLKTNQEKFKFLLLSDSVEFQIALG